MEKEKKLYVQWIHPGNGFVETIYDEIITKDDGELYLHFFFRDGMLLIFYGKAQLLHLDKDEPFLLSDYAGFDITVINTRNIVRVLWGPKGNFKVEEINGKKEE